MTKTAIEGEPPSPVLPPPGCRFHTRCPAASDTCRNEEPQLRQIGIGHFVACHHPIHGGERGRAGRRRSARYAIRFPDARLVDHAGRSRSPRRSRSTVRLTIECDVRRRSSRSPSGRSAPGSTARRGRGGGSWSPRRSPAARAARTRRCPPTLPTARVPHRRLANSRSLRREQVERPGRPVAPRRSGLAVRWWRT